MKQSPRTFTFTCIFYIYMHYLFIVVPVPGCRDHVECHHRPDAGRVHKIQRPPQSATRWRHCVRVGGAHVPCVGQSHRKELQEHDADGPALRRGAAEDVWLWTTRRLRSPGLVCAYSPCLWILCMSSFCLHTLSMSMHALHAYTCSPCIYVLN